MANRNYFHHHISTWRDRSHKSLEEIYVLIAVENLPASSAIPLLTDQRKALVFDHLDHDDYQKKVVKVSLMF